MPERKETIKLLQYIGAIRRAKIKQYGDKLIIHVLDVKHSFVTKDGIRFNRVHGFRSKYGPMMYTYEARLDALPRHADGTPRRFTRKPSANMGS